MHNADTVRITYYFKINDGNTQRDYNKDDLFVLLNDSRALIKHAKKDEEKVTIYFNAAFACEGLGLYHEEALSYIANAIAIIHSAKVSLEKLPLLHTMRANIHRFDNYRLSLKEAWLGVLWFENPLDCLEDKALSKNSFSCVYAYCYSLLALLLCIHGRLDEAEKAAQDALQIYPEDPNAHWRLDEAEKAAQDALQIYPKDQNAHWILAAIKQQRGETIAPYQTPPYHQSQLVQETPNHYLYTPHMEQQQTPATKNPLIPLTPEIVIKPEIVTSTMPATTTQPTSRNLPAQDRTLPQLPVFPPFPQTNTPATATPTTTAQAHVTLAPVSASQSTHHRMSINALLSPGNNNPTTSTTAATSSFFSQPRTETHTHTSTTQPDSYTSKKRNHPQTPSHP